MLRGRIRIAAPSARNPPQNSEEVNARKEIGIRSVFHKSCGKLCEKPRFKESILAFLIAF
jgi:hypothetical protein